MEGKFPNSDNTRNARKFEFLGEFEAKIKNTLDDYSGALMDSFGQTSLKWKISCKCTFNDSSSKSSSDFNLIFLYTLSGMVSNASMYTWDPLLAKCQPSILKVQQHQNCVVSSTSWQIASLRRSVLKFHIHAIVLKWKEYDIRIG